MGVLCIVNMSRGRTLGADIRDNLPKAMSSCLAGANASKNTRAKLC